MKAVVAAFNQEKALVGAFSVITNLRMQLFEALFRTAFTGTFKNGELVFARCSRLTGASCEGCIHVPQLSEPEGRLYSREISTHEFVTHSPTLPDPYESTMVQVKKSNVPGANDGLFARFCSVNILHFLH